MRRLSARKLAAWKRYLAQRKRGPWSKVDLEAHRHEMEMRYQGWGRYRDPNKPPKRDRLKEIAREALPALVAEVERLQARERELSSEVESLRVEASRLACREFARGLNRQPVARRRRESAAAD